MGTSSLIVDLRQALATRFPNTRWALEPSTSCETMPTGIVPLDTLLGGGLPRGKFTELVAYGHGSGSVEVIHALLRQVAMNRQFMALVDGSGSFDVGAVEQDVLTRLLWACCHKTTEALQATDLLLRDRNFPIVLLDLRLNTESELRKIGASTWYRYSRLIEQNQTIVLVVTPRQMVSGATRRVAVKSGLGLEAMQQSRATVLSHLKFRLLRSVGEREAQPMQASA